MPDQNFFSRRPALSLKDISGLSGAALPEGANGAYVIEDVAPLDKAGPKDLSFFDNVRYKEQFQATKAGACFVAPAMAVFAPKGVNLLISPSPYKAYALAAQTLYPEFKPKAETAKSAKIDPSAKIGKDCVIEEGVVIGAGAILGDQCWLEPNAVIGRNVQIGNNSRIGANASVSHALIGDHVRLYPGVRVGQDGFGFAIDPKGHVKVPQLGRVIIEDHVEVGANSTIDRGAGPDTVIGQGTWIDNLVQIGHNVRVGKGCIIVAQVGIAGSTVIEDFVAIGGQVGIAGHLNIGKGSQIGAQSGIMQNVEPGSEIIGTPALPKKDFMRQVALLKRLIKKEKGS
jgi:UDP-3-O-[3-hydroxymyristoyl] glucosamine N-acyltransferase